MKNPQKKFRTRLTALLLALVLLVSFSACGGDTQSSAPEGGASSSGEAVSDSSAAASGTVGGEADPLGKYDPPITLSWGISTSAVQQFKNGDTYEDNIWSRRYAEDLGVQLEVAFTADGSTDAYRNKLNLLLSSGNLPDIFKGDYQFFKQAVEAGYVADITGVYDQYAGDFMKDARKNYPDCFDYASIDGKQYGVPQLNDNSQNGILLWIRDDWLEKLNLEAPTTIDEMIEVAKAFVENDPDGDGQKNTVGLGLNKNLLTPDYCTLLGFVGAFGVPGFNQNIYYRDEEGKMTFSYIEPGMKEALRVLQKMYAEGLIDPEFSVKDTAALEEDIGSGKIGMAYGMQWGTWLPWNLVWQNEEVTVHPYAIPTQEGYDYKMGVENNAVGDITMINANCENPEALIKMYNLYHSIDNPDMDDETYAIYDADEQYRFSPCIINEPQEPTYAPMLAKALESGDTASLPNNLVARYNSIKGFEDGSNTGSDAYGLWGQYSLEGSMGIILNKYVPDGALVYGVVGASKPESLINNASVLEKITLQAFTEIITGADIETFDAYVENWLNAGGQQILDDLDELYPAE